MLFRRIRSRRKKRLARLLTLVVLVLFGLIGLYFYLIYTSYQIEKTLLSTEGFVRMEVERIIVMGDRSLIQLKNNCSELSFYVSPWQASSIENGINNVVPFRPSTHDIAAEILEGYRIKPLMVKITKLSEGTYFGELAFKKGNRFLILDTRPSDGIALAVRTDTPMYVNESLVMEVC